MGDIDSYLNENQLFICSLLFWIVRRYIFTPCNKSAMSFKLLKQAIKASRSWAQPYFSCPKPRKRGLEYPPGILFWLNDTVKPRFSILDSILRLIVYTRQTNP